MTVVIKDETFRYFKLQYGAPQGSVLGPLLFTLSTVDLREVIKKHGSYVRRRHTIVHFFLAHRHGHIHAATAWKLAFVT